MTSRNKKFAYASGDEENTDAFINSTIASAPKNAPSHSEEMELQTGNFAGRDGSYYSVDTGRRKEFRNNCANGIVYAFSFFLIIVSIGLFVGAAMQDKNPSFITFCPDCKKAISATFAVGGCILVIAGLGLLAARSRSGFWACLFIVGLVLLALVFFGVGIGFVVIQGGTHLDDLWRHYVTDDDTSFITNVQNSLNCNGWDFCCYNGTSVTTSTQAPNPAPGPGPVAPSPAPPLLAADNSTTTDAPMPTTTTDAPASTTVGPATTAAPTTATCQVIDWNDPAKRAEAIAMCLVYTPTPMPPCKDLLKDKMKDLTVPVAVVSFPLGVLCALVAWASKRALAKEE